MQLDAILEIAIGLILTWLLLSMTVSQFQELITEWSGWRAVFLEKRLLEMLKSQDLVAQFYKHPLIMTLNTKTPMGAERKPINIPNPIFAKAAVDIFLNAGKTGNEIPAGTMSLDGMRQCAAESMAELEKTDTSLARTVKHLTPKMDDGTAKIEDKLAEYRANTETWFDNTMVQATSLYRKNTRSIAIFIGLALAIAFNVDSIHIVNQLWRDPTLRQAIVAQAGNVDPNNGAGLDSLAAQVNALSLPLGWSAKSIPGSAQAWLIKGIGILISAFAAAQGAPFWFDILRKLAGVKQQPAAK
jgi:hypothetical protein